jgi:hypothetical protein
MTFPPAEEVGVTRHQFGVIDGDADVPVLVVRGHVGVPGRDDVAGLVRTSTEMEKSVFVVRSGFHPTFTAIDRSSDRWDTKGCST